MRKTRQAIIRICTKDLPWKTTIPSLGDETETYGKIIFMRITFAIIWSWFATMVVNALNVVRGPCKQHKIKYELTSWGRDEMADIFQTTISNAYSWMKMYEFRLKWSLFLMVQLKIVHHWFRWWLGADQATSHYLNQWCLNYWRKYVSLVLNELMVQQSILLPKDHYRRSPVFRLCLNSFNDYLQNEQHCSSRNHPIHDDVIKWKYFPRNWPFVRVIHRSPVNYPHKGQWRGALMFSLIGVWINDWVNNRETGDLRR